MQKSNMAETEFFPIEVRSTVEQQQWLIVLKKIKEVKPIVEMFWSGYSNKNLNHCAE